MISREGLRPLPGDEQEREKKNGLAAALKEQFRAVFKAITAKAEPEQKPPRKSDKDETGRIFKMAAQKVLRRVRRLPVEAYIRATDYLADTLDWLNQWQQEESFEDEAQSTPQDYLYPHL